MKRNRILILSGIAVLIVLIFVFSRSSSESTGEQIVSVEKGEFVIEVMASGALEAKNSVNIKGPTTLRNYRIWEVTIQDMIDEGTYVKKGEYVAELDKSEVEGKIQDAQLDMNQRLSQYQQAKLDTALKLREARDKLIDLEYSLREKKLVLEQSQYEPPANILKAEIELEKAGRVLEQAKQNYEIKEQQSVAEVQIAESRLSKAQNELNGLTDLSDKFTILAPEDGMLIYRKNWRGQAVKTGSQVNSWDPVVATLPDLSQMLSRTYINEVDIRKVKKGQEVEIGFDAFPDKQLRGKVVKVANVGEQRPNIDAKVFQVMIEVFDMDPLLKPGMTTSNKIITNEIDQALYIPLECLHSAYDSITYVFKKSGGRTVKQEVIIGDANEENVVVLAGLKVGDKLSLSTAEGMDDEDIELLPELNGKRTGKEETDRAVPASGKSGVTE